MKRKIREQSLYNRKKRKAIGGYSRAETKRIGNQYVKDPDIVIDGYNGLTKIAKYSENTYIPRPTKEPQDLTPEQCREISQAGLTTSNYLTLRALIGKDFNPYDVESLELTDWQKKSLINNLQRRSCTRKIKYPDRDTAKKKGRLMRQRHPGEKFSAYKCRFCPQYHIGHKSDDREVLFKGLEHILDTI